MLQPPVLHGRHELLPGRIHLTNAPAACSGRPYHSSRTLPGTSDRHRRLLP